MEKLETTLADNTDLTQFKKQNLSVSKYFVKFNQATTEQKTGKKMQKTTANLQNYLCLSNTIVSYNQVIPVFDLCETKYGLFLNMFSKHQEQPVGTSCDMPKQNFRSLLVTNIKFDIKLVLSLCPLILRRKTKSA